MQITGNGLKRPECQDIEPIQNNVDILEEHLSDTEVHVNAGRIAGITEPDELSQIDSTDNNSTIWGKIKKSISVLNDHVDTVASETILGHIKIGIGLQTEKDGATCVKIADNLETDDSTTALSAAMGQSLNENKAPNNHASTSTTYGVGNASSYGHVKLSDNYVSSDGAASAGVGASSKAISDVYNTLNNYLTYTDISSFITLNTTYGQILNSAYTENGSVYIRVQPKTGWNGSHSLFQINDSKYFPRDAINGIIGISGSYTDNGKILFSNIGEDGKCNCWITSNMTAPSSISFYYPLQK